MRIAALAAFGAACLACAHPGAPTNPNGSGLQPLPPGFEVRDPTADAAAALAHGDHRLLAYDSDYAALVPGVPGAERNCYVERLGIRIVGGHSSVAPVRAEMAQFPNIMTYSVAYNCALIAQLPDTRCANRKT